MCSMTPPPPAGEPGVSSECMFWNTQEQQEDYQWPVVWVGRGRFLDGSDDRY